MKRFISLLFLLLFAIILPAQSREELEKERNRIINEIELAQKTLQQTSASKSAKLQELQLINDKISKRRLLIDNLKNSIIVSQKAINSNALTLKNNKEQLAKIKNQYALLLRMTYLKKLGTNEWAYLLSVENLNQAFLRWSYMKQFEKYCNDKADQIKKLQLEIDSKIKGIENFKQNQAQLLQNESEQVASLENDQSAKNNILKALKKDENKLRKNLAEAQKEREKLNFAIENTILTELYKRESEPSNNDKNFDDLSSDFSENKGRFPLPVNNGYISGKFGVHPHPTLKGVKINNNGIDIQATTGAVVLAIHPGKVIGIAQIPGYNNMVIVQHGNYYTVYSRLDRVLVTKDSEISSGSPLGNISDTESLLHFEIWKNKTKENPEKWLLIE
jgi:septal ring factor EnvC (AmiA/AmiB activator)